MSSPNTTSKPTLATDYVTLLREAVRTSGLSAQAYARKILIRNPRTVRRWLAGDSPIPEAVRAYLETTGRQVASKR